jgi:hypothetical protein
VVLREKVAQVGHFWRFGDGKRSVRAFFCSQRVGAMRVCFKKMSSLRRAKAQVCKWLRKGWKLEKLQRKKGFYLQW